MSHRILPGALLASAIGGLALCSWADTRACAPVMPRDQTVAIASESALIVWDEKAKKQHFIRRASFQTEVPYFGFLVPTPTRPELAETPDEVFTQLEDWTKPEVKTEKAYVDEHISIGCPAAKTPPGNVQEAGVVEVLDQARVAGFDATVLKATDTQALQDWPAKHNYDARPQVMKWLDPYVKGGWIITAFQIAKKEEQARQVGTQAVRMSFTTERPFFPYSEPADLREAGRGGPERLLRIFFLANQRMAGALDEATVTWPGTTAWAGRLDDAKRPALAQRLSQEVSLPGGGWLTVFDDHASPRPGTTDLYFAPAAEQSEVRRPPLIHYEYVYRTPPGEIIGAVIGLLVCVGMIIIPVVLLRWLLGHGRGARTA
jgi:hypothetical protein